MYTRQIFDLFNAKPAPRGVRADLVDYEDYMAIRFYRDNFDSLPEMTRVSATEWALETATNISAILPCTIEAWETPPEDK